VVEGVESVRLVALKPLVLHGPRPAPLAVETIFVALAPSSGQVGELHWKAGALPDPPVVLHDAPVVLSWREPAGSSRPPLT
jgi:hypothetical protein